MLDSLCWVALLRCPWLVVLLLLLLPLPRLTNSTATHVSLDRCIVKTKNMTTLTLRPPTTGWCRLLGVDMSASEFENLGKLRDIPVTTVEDLSK